MDKLEEGQFVYVFVVVYPYDEVKWRVPSINDFELSVFQERTLQLCAGQAFSYKFSFEGHTLSDGHAVEVFGEARLPLFVNHQYKLYHI